MASYTLTHLKQLESESIHIIREAAACFKNPVMLYSAGKDSSCMVRLAQKAFYPGMFPFPLMHIDTGYKFPEMYAFRDAFVKEIGARLIIERNEEWIAQGTHPAVLGVDACCRRLKTQGLLDAIRKNGFDAAFGGARREEEKSRAKERVFSVRDRFGQWDPKNQRPEPWDLYNTLLNEGESVRVFPLSNWTELDIWEYIRLEKIPVVSLYFAQMRRVTVKDNRIIPLCLPETADFNDAGVAVECGMVTMSCRFRSLGCIPCTGAVRSNASDVDGIIEELRDARTSERENRIIDLTGDASMEEKKREGYF